MADSDPEIAFPGEDGAAVDTRPKDYAVPEAEDYAAGDGGLNLEEAARILHAHPNDADSEEDEEEPEEDEADSESEEEAGVNAVHAGRTPPARRRRRSRETKFNMKPESYTGEKDWEAYLSHFEDCAELSGWTSRMKKLVLSASLKGQARTYYMGLAYEEKRSYPTLVSALTRRFGTMRQREVWVAQLEGRRRQPGESISAVADDLLRMAMRAYNDLGIKAQETLALKQLYKMI